MSEIQKVSLVQSKPGIRRDGTNLDGENYADGKWVRFQRGRPKKMGGYSRSSSFLSGPVRDVQVWSRGQLNNVFTFSGHQIEVTQIDENGSGSSVTRVTPLADFTGNDEFLWSTDTMFDAAVGSEATIVLAVPTKTLSNIDDFTEYGLYFGLADGSAEFEKVADTNAVASGGVFVTSPYAVLYGSDGKVTWSNANEPQNYTTGDAGSARVTGSKIVQGHALRSGSGASGLLWALDSVIKMEYIGGNAIFRFSKVGVSSILAQNSVIEYDGVFYWIGIDRFLTSNGATVAEVPNDMNLNWFFDNLNYAQRQKIWAMKIPRFGEIWWFFPRGDATECTHAIILNLREQCWYDCELARSAGFYSQVFRYPIMFGADTNRNRSVVLTIESGTISIGDVVTGETSGATGVVVSFISDTEVVVELTSSVEFTNSESLTSGDSSHGYYANIKLLMHFDGADGASVFTDEKGHTITPHNSVFLTTDTNKFGGSCLELWQNPSGHLTSAESTDFDIGTQDFTVEMWYFWVSGGGVAHDLFSVCGTAGTWNNKFKLWKNATNHLQAIVYDSAGLATSFACATTVPNSEWVHVALTRESGTYRLFQNGILVNSATPALITHDNEGVVIGSDYANSGSTRYIDELRFIIGTAIYSEDFTPQTEEFPSESQSFSSSLLDAQSDLFSMFVHEKGLNAIEGDSELAIESYFTTADFGLPANQGLNRFTRLTRIEPDFIQRGTMTVEVLSNEQANSDQEIDGPLPFTNDTEKVDMRVQRRHLQLKFKSNEVNGHYEMGKPIMWTEPGDLRS